MKIKSVYINNLFNIHNQKITFYEPAITYFDQMKLSIIVGENGTCKTTLLKFLAEAFLYPQINKKTKIQISNGFQIEYEIKNEKILLDQTSIRDLKSEYYPSNVIVSTPALNGKFSSHSRRTSNTEYVYSGPLKSELLAIVKAIKDPKKEKPVLELLKLVGYSRNYRLVIPEKRIILNMFNKRNKNSAIDDNAVLTFIEICELVSTVHDTQARKRVIYPKDINESFINFIETFLNERININLQIEIQDSNLGNWIDIKEMSTGEQAIFGRFFSLLTLVKDDSLVLIDEPETHLHPRWIKEYILILHKLFSQYKAHLIIATHSPLIASDVPNECIIGLVKNEQTKRVSQYDVSEATLGGNPINIFNNVFRLNDHTGSFASFIIDEIETRIEQGDINKVIEMFNDLGTTVNKFSLYNKLVDIFPEELE